MSNIIKRVFAFVLSVAVISGSVSVCCLICNHPSADIENTVTSFYREPPNSLDVVMIGSSGANKDFQPSILWKKSKITSYCFTVGACSSNIYSSMLKEVVSKQPDAIFCIDIDGFVIEDKYQLQIEPVRLWVDSMPKNDNHREMINKFFADNKTERYFPFIRYHRYMTSLYAYLPITVKQIVNKITDKRDSLGGATTNSVNHTEVIEFISDTVKESPLDTCSEKVFSEFLEYCRLSDLKNIIFVNFPKGYTEKTSLERNKLYTERVNYIRNTVNKLGYSVFDYNSLGNPAKLNYKTDFADTLHLRTEGAVKFSEFFGQYLSEKYVFPQKDEATVNDWNTRSMEADILLGL